MFLCSWESAGSKRYCSSVSPKSRQERDQFVKMSFFHPYLRLDNYPPHYYSNAAASSPQVPPPAFLPAPPPFYVPHTPGPLPGYPVRIKMEIGSEDTDQNSSPDDDGCHSPRMGSSASNGGKSTECAVCSEVTDNHHMHYGAMCCFSCRAFFRRANQKTKKTVYVCKQDGNCDISFKNRKKCQKCRY